jgi:hypothetical protein
VVYVNPNFPLFTQDENISVGIIQSTVTSSENSSRETWVIHVSINDFSKIRDESFKIVITANEVTWKPLKTISYQ